MRTTSVEMSSALSTSTDLKSWHLHFGDVLNKPKWRMSAGVSSRWKNTTVAMRRSTAMKYLRTPIQHGRGWARYLAAVGKCRSDLSACAWQTASGTVKGFCHCGMRARSRYAMSRGGEAEYPWKTVDHYSWSPQGQRTRLDSDWGCENLGRGTHRRRCTGGIIKKPRNRHVGECSGSSERPSRAPLHRPFEVLRRCTLQ